MRRIWRVCCGRHREGDGAQGRPCWWWLWCRSVQAGQDNKQCRCSLGLGLGLSRSLTEASVHGDVACYGEWIKNCVSWWQRRGRRQEAGEGVADDARGGRERVQCLL